MNAASGTSGAVSSAITVASDLLSSVSADFSYVVSGGGSPTAPTLTSTQSGGSYTPVLTGSAVGYWLDAGVSWAVTNRLVVQLEVSVGRQVRLFLVLLVLLRRLSHLL